MAHSSIIKLASKIYLLSRTNAVNWIDDPLYAGYSTNFKNGKCRVYSNDAGRAWFYIHNSDDEIVDELADSDLKWDTEIQQDELFDLYKIAKRNALKSDKVIEDLMKEVDEIDIPF